MCPIALVIYQLSISHLFHSSQFANVHDVSWGTKGDNKVSTDLGVVTTGKNKNEVEVAVPTTENDIDAAYEDAIHVLSTKPPKEDKKTRRSDTARGLLQEIPNRRTARLDTV